MNGYCGFAIANYENDTLSGNSLLANIDTTNTISLVEMKQNVDKSVIKPSLLAESGGSVQGRWLQESDIWKQNTLKEFTLVSVDKKVIVFIDGSYKITKLFTESYFGIPSPLIMAESPGLFKCMFKDIELFTIE